MRKLNSFKLLLVCILFLFGMQNARATIYTISGNVGTKVYGAGDTAQFSGNVTAGVMTVDNGALVDFKGFENSGSITVGNNGTVFMSGHNHGTLTVNPGANIIVCGSLTTNGAINISGTGKVTLTQGTTLSLQGANLSTSAVMQLDYDGDPTCKAQITLGVGGTMHINLNNGDAITDDHEIWFDNGITYNFLNNLGPASRGTAALPLCSSVGACGCDAVVAGTIGSNQTICYNTVPATLTSTVAASGGNGVDYDYQWQSSPDNSAWSDIGGATSATYTPPALTSNMYYRREVTSGSCGTEYTASVLVTVRSQFVVGSIGGAQTICYNTVPAGLTSTGLPTGGAGGYTYQWQSSPDNSAWSNIGGASSSTYTPGALTASTYFRRGDIDGSCGTLYTASILVTVRDQLVAGTIADNQTVPHNSTPSALTSTVDASGGGGVNYQWQISTDGTNFSDIGGATSSTYSPPGAITQNTWYRREATSTAGCGVVYTASVMMTVVANVCNGGTPPNMIEDVAPSGGTGAYTYQWQSSTDGVTFNDIGGATSATYNPSSISNDIWYRRGVISGGCTVYTSAVKASVSSSPGGISGGLLVWLKADAGTGSIGTQWEDQSGNGYHYTAVSSPTVGAGDSSSNYNPYIELGSSDGFNAPANTEIESEHTIFLVANKLSSDSTGRILDGHTGDFLWGYSGGYGKSLKINSNPSAATSNPADPSSSTTMMMQTFQRTSGGAYTHRVDGASAASYGSSDNPNDTVRIDINQGANAGSESSASRIYELIIYNSALSSAEIDEIESYLMTKYGVGNNSNYLTSAGGTTYSVSSYPNDIIGIGKECYFNQKQSGADDDSVRIWVSNGSWAATNAAHSGSITNDISYVMVGHNGGRLRANAAANAEKPSGITNRIAREWKITNTNFDDDFTMEIEWDSTDAFSLSDIRLLVDDDGDFSNATVYASGDQGMTFSLGSIIIAGIPPAVVPKGGTKFVTIGSAGATPLPVELVSFEAIKHDDAVELRWETAAELNNDYFEIERSSDGVSWEYIGQVMGAGNSNELISYEFWDYEKCGQKCYYRLKQVDFDGGFEYSDKRMVSTNLSGATALKVYPVPVEEIATVEFNSTESGLFVVKVISVSGVDMYKSHVVCAEGSNTFEVNVSHLAKGLYYMVVSDADGKVLNREVFTK